MKKAIKWLVLGVFALTSVSFAVQQIKIGTNDPPKPKGGAGCRSTIEKSNVC